MKLSSRETNILLLALLVAVSIVSIIIIFLSTEHLHPILSSYGLGAVHFNDTAPRPEERKHKSTVSESFKQPIVNKLEQGLAKARASIIIAASNKSLSLALATKNHDILSTEIYHNAAAFYQSYMEMERRFKVYVYEEGELPVVHDGPCKDLYTIEGRFIHAIEHGTYNQFRTNDANEAHVFFMPFSVTNMVRYIYTPNPHNVTPLQSFVSDYVRKISIKYPFWNHSQGADHFMLSCHDWGPYASEGNQILYDTSIRALCNANSSEGFNPQKDVTVPEINLNGGEMHQKLLSPPFNYSRPYLAFFVGRVSHGPIRPIILKYWKGDPDLQVYDKSDRQDQEDYFESMLHSKFCLCPSGYEVASPRIAEAIYAECIPVLISVNYVLPFSDVLKWEAFSIHVNVSEIARLKEILMAVSEDEYLKLKEGVRAVRRNFVLNQPMKRFDVFHMILHSIWLRRLNLRIL